MPTPTRDLLIDQYISLLDMDERKDLLFDLIQESGNEEFTEDWLHNVVMDIHREALEAGKWKKL